MKYCLLFCCIIGYCIIGKTQARLFSPQQLQEDLDHLVAGAERYNPAMYAYFSKEDFEQQMAAIRQGIKQPMDALSFFKILCQAVEGMEEGHITIGSRKDAFYHGFLEGDFKSLPLSVKFLGEKAYVWNNLSRSDHLERGDEILSINGRSIAAIRAQIFQHTVSDGQIETFKQERLTKEFSARYFWFVEQTDSFFIEFKRADLIAVQQVHIEALTRSEMASWATHRQLKQNRPLGINQIYSLSINKEKAILTLRSFNEALIKENNLKPYAFYEEIFKRLRKNKVKHLILDLRDNIGGMKEFGDALLAFGLKKNKKGIFRELLSWNATTTQATFPKRNRWFFKGTCYVLTNGATYSTAALIAQYLKIYTGAIVIGKETGSRYEGFAAGNYHHLILPNSKITIGIPNKWVKNQLPYPPMQSNRGLMPTYPVDVTIEDLMLGKDPVLEKALELIKKS